MMALRNKRVLITAGPTWIPIDGVRIISNTATGETGILLAKKLNEIGAKVTLVLGAVTDCPEIDKGIKIIRFKFFNELKETLNEELSCGKYDIMIHSAAVSDYKPLKKYGKKVKSGRRPWIIELTPTEKLIDNFKKIEQSIFLMGFKFEPGINKDLLIRNAKRLIRRAGADLIVANTIARGRYTAWITAPDKIYGPVFTKNDLAKAAITAIGESV